jgi:sialidase-1
VETEDHVVYLNVRSGGKPRRAYSWSQDGGATWSEVQWHEEVPEPASCQGSVIRFTDAQRHDKNRVVLANPAGPTRERLTIRLSYDECRTWNAGKVLHPGPAAYSDLGVLPGLTVGCLYEAGEQHPYQTIRFARFTLEWLTDGADRLGGER